MKAARTGQSIIEVLVAVVVGVVLVGAAAGLIAPSLQTNTQATRVQAAAALAKQLSDNVRVWSEGDWHNILNLATTSANKYYLIASTSPFTATSGVETVTVSTTTYSRYFYLTDVYRDGGGNATTTATGNSYDPSTKLITVAYNWPNGTTTTLSAYLTRNRNSIYDQTDWSGGPNQAGPATTTNSRFSTSTSNISYASTTGSILLALVTNTNVEVASDTFNRGDSSTLGSNWSVYYTCGPGSSALIIGNMAAASTSGPFNTVGNFWSASTFNNDQYSKATLTQNLPSGEGTVFTLMVRSGNAFCNPGVTQNTSYGGGVDRVDFGLQTDPPYYRIWKKVNNTATNLVVSSQAAAMGDVVELDAKGTSLKLIVNGLSILNATDTDISSGYPGIQLRSPGLVGVGFLDNWSGGNLQ